MFVSVTMTVAIVSIMIIVTMMTATKSWPDNLISNVKSDGFPEIPEPTRCGSSVTNSSNQPLEYEERQETSHHLQDHVFGDLKITISRNFEMIRAQIKDVPARQFEIREVANVVEIILVTCH